MSQFQLKKLEKMIEQVHTMHDKFVIFLSISDKKTRAKVTTIREESRVLAVKQLEKKLAEVDSSRCFVRIDVLTTAQEYSYVTFNKLLKTAKRNNYYSFGVSFDKKFKTAFLAEELQGRALLKPEKGHIVGYNKPNLEWDKQNLVGYLREKKGNAFQLVDTKKPSIVFYTQGFVYEESNGGWIKLSLVEGKRGLRETSIRTMPEDILQTIVQGKEFLQEQLLESGKFVYGYFPTYDKKISGYNSVRHFSSLYALLEAQEFLQSEKKDLEKTEKGLDWGLENLTIEQEGCLYIKEETRTGISVKLGAQALAILALAKFQTTTGNKKYEKQINQLVEGIETAFLTETDDTIHILDEHLQVKKKFNIIYYDGEAVFSILRAYGITKNESHLALAKRLFEKYVEKGYERYHDHWLSYATNELLLYTNEAEYYLFGFKNALDNLAFIEERDTVYPTMLELLMAAVKMADKFEKGGSYEKEGANAALSKITRKESWKLKEVAIKRAEMEYEKGVLHPEIAMYMKSPEKVVNGFYTRHDRFRMRIDDQEHFLSGLVNFYAYFYGEEK